MLKSDNQRKSTIIRKDHKDNEHNEKNFHLTSFQSFLSSWFANFRIKCEWSKKTTEKENQPWANWRRKLEDELSKETKLGSDVKILFMKFEWKREKLWKLTKLWKVPTKNNNHISSSTQDSSSAAFSHSHEKFSFNLTFPRRIEFSFSHVFVRLSYHKLFAIDVWWSKILGAIFRLQRFWCENIQSEIRAFASLFALQDEKCRVWIGRDVRNTKGVKMLAVYLHIATSILHILTRSLLVQCNFIRWSEHAEKISDSIRSVA